MPPVAWPCKGSVGPAFPTVLKFCLLCLALLVLTSKVGALTLIFVLCLLLSLAKGFKLLLFILSLEKKNRN